jgi:hypothetical protein
LHHLPRALVAVTLTSVMALTACMTDRILVDDPRAPPGQERFTADQRQMSRVQQTTARLRHLPFKNDVPVDVMTVQELKAWFDRYADARKDILAREDRFHHRLGILPPTTSTAQAFSGFLVDFVGGVYDDDRKRMILVSDYAWWSKLQQDAAGVITGVDWAYELFLVHELVHALQDQHFGLRDMLRGGVYDDNDDAAFVRKTLLETEANVIGMAHFLGMDLSQLATRKAFFLFLRYNNLLNGPLMSLLSGRTPSFFAKQTFAQYELGLSYVERKLDEGGVDALSTSYLKVPGEPGAMPESTEQLLWPRKLRRDSLDPPRHLPSLRGVPSALVGGTHVLTNVFGALAFRHWLADVLGPIEAAAVADGWGGDRYDIIDQGASSVLLWRSVWDSDEDASEAFAAFESAVQRRYGDRTRVIEERSDATGALARFFIPSAPAEERLVRTLRDEELWLERRGNQILWIDGVTPETAAALSAELWPEVTVVDRPALQQQRLRDREHELQQQLARSWPLSGTPPERPGLAGRFALPPRTIAVRLGAGVDAQLLADDTLSLQPLTDMEIRWGFRPGLELTLPLGLVGYVDTVLGKTIFGASARTLFPSPSIAFAAGHVWTISDDLAVVAQAQVQRPTEAIERSWRWGAGVMMRPHDALVLTPSMSLLQGHDNEIVVIGAALERGFVPAPLMEVEVIDGLFLYQSSTAYFRRYQGLRLLGHSHVLGLAFYF